MEDSKNSLEWKNYEAVYEGKEQRNKLAHESKLASKEDCLRYVVAVRQEFIAWGILTE